MKKATHLSLVVNNTGKLGLVRKKKIMIAKGNVKAFGKQDGLWTNYSKLKRDNVDVKVFIETEYFDRFSTEVEIYPYICLRVYFNRNHFNTKRHGLIYTDSEFEKNLNKLLHKHNIKGHAFYTEHGAQGNSYVHMGADKQMSLFLVKKYHKELGIDLSKREQLISKIRRARREINKDLKATKLSITDYPIDLDDWQYSIQSKVKFSNIIKKLENQGWKRTYGHLILARDQDKTYRLYKELKDITINITIYSCSRYKYKLFYDIA